MSESFRRRLHLLAFIALSAVELYRTFQTGYPPVFSPFDSLLLLTAMFVLLSGLMKTGKGGTILSAIFIVSMFFVPYRIKEIPPIVRTPLFILHVFSAMIAYAVFISLSIVALLDIKDKKLNFKKPLTAGFFFFTTSMIVGGTWAYLAWADLFPLEPKSLFSLFLWLYSAFLIHVETDRTFNKFKHILIIACGGFVLFSYFGINFLLGGTHGF
ncbi:cytochrome c biogenesis protein CcsA [Desulfurobacterium sp.]